AERVRRADRSAAYDGDGRGCALGQQRGEALRVADGEHERVLLVPAAVLGVAAAQRVGEADLVGQVADLRRGANRDLPGGERERVGGREADLGTRLGLCRLEDQLGRFTAPVGLEGHVLARAGLPDAAVVSRAAHAAGRAVEAVAHGRYRLPA